MPPIACTMERPSRLTSLGGHRMDRKTRGQSPGEDILGDVYSCIAHTYIRPFHTNNRHLIWTKYPAFLYIQLGRIPTYNLTPEYRLLCSGVW